MDIDLDTSFPESIELLGDPQFNPAPISLVLSNPSNLDAHPFRTGKVEPSLHVPLNLDATLHSPLFPSGHKLNPHFVRHYELEDELGSGGYGFVMTARHRTEGYEVAVKFIVKSKVPDHAWMEDEAIGRLPTEVMLLSFIEHENIVKCLDLFEDSLYFYLIQELHGSPWPKAKRNHHASVSTSTSSTSLTPSTPALSPSVSISSLPSSTGSSPTVPHRHLEAPAHQKSQSTSTFDISTTMLHPSHMISATRPEFSRRPSHDLFECIEQSDHKRLSEKQARCVFSQVVDAVSYLDSQGVTHRDIKDENLVIDRNLKVKLIDFGSAAVVDPSEPQPYYNLFYGTTAYASPEILLKKEYQAPPAEIWTLGVLLSYLLTGTSPFPTVRDAVNGRIVLADIPGARLSRTAMNLMRRCLDPNSKTRATIAEVKAHRWLV
ncbi:kinase-like domain-containing protein [Lyophyllum atratum]|nr:kinase-like domain-containing protein [Lyophyllum atratum]